MKISAGVPVWRAAAGAGGGAVRVGGEVAAGGGGLDRGPGGGQPSTQYLHYNEYLHNHEYLHNFDKYLHKIYTRSASA